MTPPQRRTTGRLSRPSGKEQSSTETSSVLLAAVNSGALDWIEQVGPFGDWRCAACLEPLDVTEERATKRGRTLAQYVEDLVAHMEVCDA